ncbi:MAG TPA: hypothetical protein VH143_12605 [Kofleriaceae bacterium]|nr:hypothetical protein [Kofleriaceae bacterium]
MRGLLVRVGIDQAFGGWNAPVDPDTHEFVYVPIPDRDLRPNLATRYASVSDALGSFASARVTDDKARALPVDLTTHVMHLDPDFRWLTYGDTNRRGKGLAAFDRDDVVVFYAGLRPCRPSDQRASKLIYAIIGVYRVSEVVRLSNVEESRWHENAHTRRSTHAGDDLIVRASPRISGRLRKCIPIGGWRDGAYRVFPDLLVAWGDLSCKDGFLQRSAVPPTFRDPERFVAWLADQQPEFMQANN